MVISVNLVNEPNTKAPASPDQWNKTFGGYDRDGAEAVVVGEAGKENLCFKSKNRKLYISG